MNKIDIESLFPHEINEHLSLLYKVASILNSSLDIEKILNLEHWKLILK